MKCPVMAITMGLMLRVKEKFLGSEYGISRFKQQPSTQESHHDRGRAFSLLKQPSR